MLLNLRIRDFAIIDEADVDFDRGFTVVTGETGAGKSILVDALMLALGARAAPMWFAPGLTSRGSRRLRHWRASSDSCSSEQRELEATIRSCFGLT